MVPVVSGTQRQLEGGQIFAAGCGGENVETSEIWRAFHFYRTAGWLRAEVTAWLFGEEISNFCMLRLRSSMVEKTLGPPPFPATLGCLFSKFSKRATIASSVCSAKVEPLTPEIIVGNTRWGSVVASTNTTRFLAVPPRF